MPMKKGKSRSTISQNIREFHTGKTYEHTKEKFGKETANKQAIAAALNTARRSRSKPASHDRAKHEPHKAIGMH